MSSLCVSPVAEQLHHVCVVCTVGSMVVLLVVHSAPLKTTRKTKNKVNRNNVLDKGGSRRTIKGGSHHGVPRAVVHYLMLQ